MAINTAVNVCLFSYKMKLIERVFILVLVACFAGNCACVSSGSSLNSISTFGYQAAVLCPVIMCSGAVVSQKNVLTTATCINGLLPADVEVRVGSIKYYDGGFTFYVEKIVMHPNFDRVTYESNMAMLTVTIPFGTTAVPIPLATKVPDTNTLGTVSAYGAINANLDLPDVLQKATLTAFSRTVCQQWKNNRLTATMFCAGDSFGKKDLCAADQGAPIVFGNVLYGIFSWGASCGLANPNPSTPVFNSIVAFQSWIQSNIISS